MVRIQINTVVCRQCGLCALVCPQLVLEAEKRATPVVAHAGRCITCFTCEDECPEGAIRVQVAVLAKEG